MNKFTNIVKDDWNLDEIQVDYGKKAWYILTIPLCNIAIKD